MSRPTSTPLTTLTTLTALSCLTTLSTSGPGPQAEPAPLATAAWIRTALRSTEWVDATPFRAHLHYLVGASRLSGRVVAEHCGIPTRLADRLLVVGEQPVDRARPTGRGTGSTIRRARKISHCYAARLLAVRPTDLLALQWRNVDSAETLRRLDRAVAGGHDLRRFAATVRASASELEQLVTHRWSTCRQLVAVQVAAAGQVAGPDQRLSLTKEAGERVALRSG